ncbi:protein kinase [Streptomyces sp. NPDC048594]|uniref:serine/threonine-protein kinase n=1 Tax=Streptomyces sp. NPDC048594 TaxID=3365575 RepID=UPI0037162905
MLELDGSGAEPLEDDDPRRIGPIPLIGRLGAGGMGRVYLGVHEGRYAAVKQLLPSIVAEDKDFLRRFGHELDNLARLPARATAPLLAGDRTASPPWFATAYVPGLTLNEAVGIHGGPLPADALWLLLREAASGLAAVHAMDMVHRDLKPSNVMLTLDGLTLIDFGVARAAEQSRLTRTGMVVGTPAYMSPEQASGARSSSGAVDVFALGSVLAYAASGRPPFGEESGHAVLYRIVHEEPDLGAVRELDPDLADVVAACLDKDHEGRPTAAELVGIADRHGPFTPPLWPESVTGHLTRRAAFAETVPDAADLPAEVPVVPPAAVAAEPERRERRRRTRVLFAVIPVVVGAASTVAVQLLPHATDSGAEAGAGPSSSVPASASSPTGPAASRPGMESPAPSTSASPSVSASSGGEGRDGGGAGTGEGRSGGTGSGTGSGSGSGGGAEGADGSDGSGGSSGSGGSGSTGDSGGSGGSGSSGGSAGSNGAAGSGSGSGSGSGDTDQDPPASGYFGLRNGEEGKCLIQVLNRADTGFCTDMAAHWTFRGAGNGAVKVVNKSGSCLSANMKGQAVLTGDCATNSTALLWRTGSGSTLRSVFSGGCLDLAFGPGVDTQTCGAGAASQKWTRN